MEPSKELSLHLNMKGRTEQEKREAIIFVLMEERKQRTVGGLEQRNCNSAIIQCRLPVDELHLLALLKGKQERCVLRKICV